MTKYINNIKSVSSRILFQEYPEIKKKLCKGHLLSTSYCLLATGQTTLDVLKRYFVTLKLYVEEQGEEGKEEISKCHRCGW